MQNILELFILVTLSLLFLTVSTAMAETNSEDIRYELGLSFEMGQQRLFGTAHIIIPPEKELGLSPSQVRISRILLSRLSTTPVIVEHQGVPSIRIRPADEQQEIFISFEKEVIQQGDNIIDHQGITLLHDWYPRPVNDVQFSVFAELPSTFSAITESDHVAKKKDDIHSFTFSKKTQDIHFIAAPFIINSLDVRDGLAVYTYFSDENQTFSADYLRAAKKYLQRYEELIGEYPYNHFAIIENLLPTGYGMPTFTLLGKSVIRLPFIKDTSLGHEILHSWFGNSVEVHKNSANWAEGLTSYMADWLYREDKQQGSSNRKENIIKYLSYVTQETAIPLNSFTSASHNQPLARSIRSVGYIKGAMVFHELRKLVGHKSFYKALQTFYSRFRDKKAGWDDIQDVFESVTDMNLDSFFQQRLELSTIPDITIEDISSDETAELSTLNFTVKQNTSEPLVFSLPIEVDTNTGPEYFTTEIRSAEQEISLQLESPPTTLTIDPDYDLLRKLHEDEQVVTWSYFMGPNPVWVIPDDNNNTIYTALLDSYGKENWQIKKEGSYDKNELAEHNLILLGSNNPIAKSYFGSPTRAASGIVIQGRKHPLNKKKAILLVSAPDNEQVAQIVRRLSHYGKYSYLHFIDGRVVDRDFHPGQMGMQYRIADEPQVLPTQKVKGFNDTINEVAHAKVVYVGETHTSMRDHHLQYLVIESLYKHNKDIAIGLEMFPASSQGVLDRYISGEKNMTEREFIKQSRYFKVWRFDYRYYQKIINFAKKNGIPLIGLNIEREIVSSIFKNGSTDKLTKEQKEKLPQGMDLSLPGYYERLSFMHNQHAHRGSGKGNVGGFIQAQATWDEVMAENIANYLNANLAKQMIVLAGSQHTRKDSGIPPRVKRRLDITQYTLHTADNIEKPTESTADYVVYLEEKQLPVAGKIGISLEEIEKNGDNFVKVTGLTAESNAGKAGLLIGDKLHVIDGYPIKEMEDIRIAMIGALPGDIISVEISRSTPRLEDEKLMFNVELHQPND